MTPRMIPKNAARLGNKNGFSQELPQDVAAARADRFADADFLGPLGHANEHDVHDADAGGDERDETDDERADAHDAGNGNKRAFERVVRVNLEIVFLVWHAGRARFASRRSPLSNVRL